MKRQKPNFRLESTWVTILLMAIIFGASLTFYFLQRNGDSANRPDLFKASWKNYASAMNSHLGFSKAKHLVDLKEQIDPATFLPRSFAFEFEAIKSLHELDQSCQEVPAFPDNELEKARVWGLFLCHKMALPADFFKNPPFLHPLGQSYYERARALSKEPFSTKAWQSEHLIYAHGMEVRSNVMRSALKDKLPLLYYASFFNASELQKLLHGEHLVLGETFALVSLFNDQETGVYHVVDTGKLLPFMEAQGFKLETLGSPPCEFSQGSSCWSYVDHMRFLKGGLVCLIVLAIMALSFLQIRFILVSNKERKANAEDRLFILQTLAHEVRTPATGIVLASQSLRDGFDLLTEEMQDAYLRLCNDVQRLQRVIATSTRYLRAEQDTDRLQVQLLPSIEDFFSGTLESYEGRVQLEICGDDRPFSTDFSWLQVCVTNLVDNALNHGKGQVTVTVGWDNSQLQIQVSDEGTSEGFDLEKLAKPFVKSVTSKGLGLGLTIVRRVALLLKGNLAYRGPPTTFILTLPNIDIKSLHEGGSP